MKVIRITTITLALLATGCAGKLYTVINPDLSIPGDGSEKKVRGIIAYPLVNVMEVHLTTILTDKTSGNVLGSAENGDCIPGQVNKFSVRTEFTSPYRIFYEPGLLESNKFGVTLKDGTLVSVNTESDPTKGVTAVTAGAAALLPFIKAPKTAVASQGPICNAGLKLVGVFEAPSVQPFDEAPQ